MAVMALASLHNYIDSLEPRHSSKISCAGSNGDLMLFCAISKGYGGLVHLHRLTLAFVTVPKVSRATSNGDLCAIHASSIDSG